MRENPTRSRVFNDLIIQIYKEEVRKRGGGGELVARRPFEMNDLLS